MNDIFSKNIKDLINSHPAMAAALQEFDIGCTSCNVGTCQLKDIIEMHNLSVADEKRLFQKIAAIVFPNQNVEIPPLPRKSAASGSAPKFSPPMKMLVEEHTIIKMVLAAIPTITASLESTLPQKKQLLENVIDFIKNFADKFHHAKEEDLLFKQFDSSLEIVRAMLEEHEIGRSHVRAVVAGLEQNDAAAISTHLEAYGALLVEHIRKEDEILYPWMDKNLTDSQIGQLYSKFNLVGDSFGEKPAAHSAFAKHLSTYPSPRLP